MDGESADIPALLRELTSDIRQTLGSNLVALYVTGSYVAGGFDPTVSDLDLVAVTRVDAAELDLERIRAMHAAFFARNPEWSDEVEVVYISAEAVGSFRSSSGSIAVISPGEPFHLRPEPPADWVQNWYALRTSSVVLFGPPTTALIPDVEWSEFAEACRRYLIHLADGDLTSSSSRGLAYTVLTACRGEEAIVGGRSVSKEEAAAIAQGRHPEFAGVLDEAIECRRTKGASGLDSATSRSAAIEFTRNVAASLSEPGTDAPVDRGEATLPP